MTWVLMINFVEHHIRLGHLVALLAGIPVTYRHLPFLLFEFGTRVVITLSLPDCTTINAGPMDALQLLS